MPRIYKGSEATLKLLVHNCVSDSEITNLKINLYTVSTKSAIEITDGYVIEENIATITIPQDAFNNMEDGVINYVAKGLLGDEEFVTQRQSNYYLKTTTNFIPSHDGNYATPDWNAVEGEDGYIANKPSFKTINNESIIGEGNITIEGGTTDLSDYYTKDEVDDKISTIDFPKSSTPDWNAKEDEDGYILNRTHYTEIKETFYDNIYVEPHVEYGFDMTDCNYVLITSNEGDVVTEYLIKFNDEDGGYDSFEYGDVLFESRSYSYVIFYEESSNVKFTIQGINIKKLDETYISDNIATKYYVADMISNSIGTISPNWSESEKYADGYIWNRPIYFDYLRTHEHENESSYYKAITIDQTSAEPYFEIYWKVYGNNGFEYRIKGTYNELFTQYNGVINVQGDFNIVLLGNNSKYKTLRFEHTEELNWNGYMEVDVYDLKRLDDIYTPSTIAKKEYVDNLIGDINNVLDNIIG